MGKQLHQDFWKVGSRFYFKKDGENRHRDMGVIQTVNPSFEQESNKTYDPDGGINTVVETSVTSTTETYALTCLNFNLDNVLGLFKGDTLTEYAQVAEEVVVSHTADRNGLLKVVSGTGKAVYGLRKVSGIYSGTPTAALITDIDVSLGKITFDVANAPEVGFIIIRETGLSYIDNAGTYEIESVSGQVATLTEASRAKLASNDETGLTTSVALIELTGDTATIYEETTSWEVFQSDQGLRRGLIKIPAASAILDDTDVSVVYSKNPITGLREFKAGTIPSWTGEGFLTFSRGGGVDELAREFSKVILTFTNPSFSVDESSTLELQIEVISVDGDAGRVIDYAGDITEY